MCFLLIRRELLKVPARMALDFRHCPQGRYMTKQFKTSCGLWGIFSTMPHQAAASSAAPQGSLPLLVLARTALYFNSILRWSVSTNSIGGSLIALWNKTKTLTTQFTWAHFIFSLSAAQLWMQRTSSFWTETSPSVYYEEGKNKFITSVNGLVCLSTVCPITTCTCTMDVDSMHLLLSRQRG